MFKRRSNYEKELPSGIFDVQNSTPSPYRTPTQAYPQHREEAEDVLNQEVSEEESWQPAGLGRNRLNLEEPETIIGEGIKIKGEISFERFIRIDGEFEGELISEGKVTVGPKGVVRADLNLNEAIIEGTVEGNITVKERLELRGDARVHGDISARLLAIDEGVTIVGKLTVNPVQPE